MTKTAEFEIFREFAAGASRCTPSGPGRSASPAGSAPLLHHRGPSAEGPGHTRYPTQVMSATLTTYAESTGT